MGEIMINRISGTQPITAGNCTRTSILIFAIFIATLSAASKPIGLTYTLSTENNTTQEGREAYARITIAMDSAMYYYNMYTSITKAVKAAYVPSVSTADGNSNGSIRFGSNKTYQVTLTAMHEIAHTIGIGTSTKWTNLINGSKVYTGTNGTKKLKEIDGANAVLKGDDMHFWPYGLNYASEVKSNQDLINHCLIVDAIYKDLYPTGIAVLAANPSFPPFTVTMHPDAGLTFHAVSGSRIEATIFTLAGQLVAGYSRQCGLPGDYTIPLNRTQLPHGQYIYRIVAGDARMNGVFVVAE
jgi:hypothetical protein